jgi:hypothetical protein
MAGVAVESSAGSTTSVYGWPVRNAGSWVAIVFG